MSEREAKCAVEGEERGVESSNQTFLRFGWRVGDLVCIRKKLLYRRWDNYACEFEADDFPRSPETPQSKNNFQFARSRQCDATIKRELTLRMKVSAN